MQDNLNIEKIKGITKLGGYNMTELLKREDQRVEDTWDLSSIFESDEAWEKAYESLEKEINKANDYKEKGINSAEDLLEAVSYTHLPSPRDRG